MITLYDAKKSTWLNPNIEYLFNDEIIEYDIQDAGFSIIKEFNLLPDSQIRELAALNKGIERHVMVGKIQRNDKEFSKALSNKFAEVRSIFITLNNLSDDRIISVKKDAIYTIGKCNKLNFGKVHFAPKNVYTSYIRLANIQNLELYYGDSGLDVKGLGENALNSHRLFMLEFLSEEIKLIESKQEYAKRKLMTFIEKYKRMELDEEYYLEFNNRSAEVNPVHNYLNILIPLAQICLNVFK